MPQRLLFALQKFRPGRLFALLLASIFGVEAVVMLLLPRLLPANISVSLTALVDACLLTSLLAPVVWMLVIRPLQLVAEMRQRMLAMVLSAQEEERRRIARDLHDELGQSLTGLLVGLRTIEEASTEEAVRTLARRLRQVGSDTHAEIRRLARGLRPAILDDAGLHPALEHLLADLCAIQDIDAHFEPGQPDIPRLPGDIETSLYRIVQEATANAVRHGKATRLRVSVKATPQEVRLTICDNGQGFEPARVMRQTNAEAPFGLTNIFERAWLCGGDVSLQSQVGQGATIEVRIPLPATEVLHVQDSRSGG